MRKIILIIMVLSGIAGLTGSKSPDDPSKWSDKKIEKWFGSGAWSEGWSVKPDQSVNKKEFVISYFKNKSRWEKAFKFLAENDLGKLEVRKYELDGDKLFATVSEYLTKDEETTNFEAHRKYIDIQYVIIGREIMNVAPLKTACEEVTPYDEAKDIEFLKVLTMQKHAATQENFFIFFPSDAHRPGIKENTSARVRKLVIKVKAD
jgi:YhcH/YjgK/YiaL family protein